MSGNVPISQRGGDMTAPTPQNTPLNTQPLTREALSRPTVGTIGEENEEAPNVNALMANPALAGMVQSKLSGLVGRSSGYIESLPPHLKRRVEGLKGIHVKHTKIEAEFQKEILELEKKYAERYRPLYQRRAAIVQGKEEPTKDEVQAGEASHEDDDDEDGSEAGDKNSLADVTAPADGEKGIPEYWLTALKNHVALSELITERDEEALRSLVDVRMSYLPGTQAGFKLEFHFDPSQNAFFTNEVLTKTYYYQDEVGFSGDLVYDHAEGDKISWKDDKDLTHKIETKKQRNKNTNQTRTVKRSVPVESFFNFFSPPKPPKGDDNEDTDFDELDERLELDYQIGEDLKDRIIPHSIMYFTGEATAYEMDDEDFGDDFEDEDEDDEDEEDEDGNTRPMAVSAGSQAENQECKQQ